MLPAQKQQITDLFQAVLAPIAADAGLAPGALPAPTLERPRDPSHGDVASNIAMQLAKPMKTNPRALADRIVAGLLAQPGRERVIASAAVAGPGFINLTLAREAHQAVVSTILAEGDGYGNSDAGRGTRVLVEFVSANPTGPLHVGHGRQGALGDALCALLQSQGCEVLREFYYNDAGVQIANLALSVQARAKGFKPGDAGWPEAAYNGDYIADIAADFLAKRRIDSDGATVAATGNADDLESIRRFAVAYLRREQDRDLQAFGIRFDNYYLESSLYTDGKVAAAVEALRAAGKTYQHDGALWLRTTDYGDDKDRVMQKSDGTYTYFVPDVAYHVVKWQRGYARAINVQGSDHHGTIARVRAGLQAAGVGIPKGYPDYVLHKMVTVMKNGEEVKISKRAGSYVTLRDLIEWSAERTDANGETSADLARGRDAVRFFLVSRKADTEFVFDVDLARAQSDENPVYYVQYAHARICSVLAQWGGDEATLRDADLSPLTSPREAALIATLADYPEMLRRATEELGPHHVAFYLRELAGQLHSYYNAERVLVDDRAMKTARLALLSATRQVLRNGLALIGVSAPARM